MRKQRKAHRHGDEKQVHVEEGTTQALHLFTLKPVQHSTYVLLNLTVVCGCLISHHHHQQSTLWPLHSTIHHIPIFLKYIYSTCSYCGKGPKLDQGKKAYMCTNTGEFFIFFSIIVCYPLPPSFLIWNYKSPKQACKYTVHKKCLDAAKAIECNPSAAPTTRYNPFASQLFWSPTQQSPTCFLAPKYPFYF